MTFPTFGAAAWKNIQKKDSKTRECQINGKVKRGQLGGEGGGGLQAHVP